MVQLQKANLLAITFLRIEYYKLLPKFQALYFELMIGEAEVYDINNAGLSIGNGIVTTKLQLIECYVKDQFVQHCSTIIQTLSYRLIEHQMSSIKRQTGKSLMDNQL